MPLYLYPEQMELMEGLELTEKGREVLESKEDLAEHFSPAARIFRGVFSSSDLGEMDIEDFKRVISFSVKGGYLKKETE